jgi:hypothetical protein
VTDDEDLSSNPRGIDDKAPGEPWVPVAAGDVGRARPSTTLVLPSRTDPIVTAASAVIGGPAGKRLIVGTRRFGPGGGLLWIVTVLCLLAGVTLGLGVLQKQHCRASGWNSPDQYWHACYSDTAVLFGSAELGRADGPGLVEAVAGRDDVPETGAAPDDRRLGQPPLTATAMWLVSRLAQGENVAAARRFFDLSALLMAAALAVAVACVAAASGRRPWDAAQVALAPILVTVGLLSYDLLAVALAAASLLAWSRHRSVLAGVLAGLAASARPMTAAIVIAVLALTIRTGQSRVLLRYLLPAAVTWVGLRLVLFPGATGGFVDSFRSWRQAGAGYGSLWLVPQLIGQSEPRLVANSSVLHAVWYKGAGLSATLTTLAVLLCLVAVTVTTVVLGLAMPDRPRLAHLALFAVAGMFPLMKSVPVQASLVLLPLIALAGLRWRDHLVWATTELAYFVGVWLYIGASSDANKGLPAGAYLVLLLARLAGIVWLIAASVRAMRDPMVDPVRIPLDGSPGTDDPLGGALDGASDALVVRVV